MGKLVILHLSDMHFTNSRSYTEDNVRSIVNALHNSIVNISNLLIIVSGDLAYSGKKAEYQEFDRFYIKLVQSIKDRYSNVNHIEWAIVPGNHDMDYDHGSYTATELEHIQKNNQYEEKLDNEYVKQAEFLSYAKSRGHINHNNLINTQDIRFDGYTIRLNLINSAVFSIIGKGDEGYHYISVHELQQLDAACDVDFIFSVMHHPHYWFTWECKYQLEQALIEKSDIVFLGHEHFSGSHNIESDGLSTKMQEGGLLSDQGNWENSDFYIGILDLPTREYQLSRYSWDPVGEIYLSERKEDKQLSKDRWNRLGFSLKPSYLDAITKDTRFLIGHDIGEYYVFPVMEEEKCEGDTIQKYCMSSSQLLQLLSCNGKMLIKGGKESGKTILMRQLFLYLRDISMPVLIDSDSFMSINPQNVKEEKIQRVIIDNVGEEFSYNRAAIERYYQSQENEKAIIIDNFDLIHPNVQEGIINYVSARYGIIVLTCQRDIEFDILERARIEQLLVGFQIYTISPFFRKKRIELVERVVNTLGDNTDARNRTIEAVNSLLGNTQQLYRWDPSFIIQLSIYAYENLQTAGAKDGDLFGHVFQANLTTLIAPQIKKIKVEIGYALIILDQIAYSAHTKEKYPIPYDLIVEAIEEYNKRYRYNCPPIEFIRCLVDANIIKSVGNNYVFCQTSYYAFFVAREMRRRCQDDQDFSEFTKALERAYLPVNANIVLFVTYLYDSKVLIRLIKDMAKQCVNGWEEFNLSNPKQQYFTNISLPKLDIQSLDSSSHDREKDDNERAVDLQIQKMWESPYDHNGEISNEDLMSRSLSLMIIASQLLPNLGYIIEGEDKTEFVELIYKMPFQIFNAWASAIDIDKVSIIKDIQKLYSLEYRNAKAKDASLSDEAALVYLRRESISLLLEIMNISMTNASRTSTFTLLDDFDHSQSIGYELEWLMSFDKRPVTEEYFKQAERIHLLSKDGIQKYMAKQIIRHYMSTKAGIKGKDLQRLNSSIFDNKIPQHILLADQKAHEARR